MARIGIDATSILPNGKGLSRYEKNIVQSLSCLESEHEYFVFLNDSFRVNLSVKKSNWHFLPVPIWKTLFWEQLQLPCYAKKFKLDLIHHSLDRPSYLAEVPIVLFLFESPHSRSEWIPKRSKGKSWYIKMSHQLTQSVFPHTLRLAKRIIVSSECTKTDLIENFQVSADKIRVIYPGCEEGFKPLLDTEALLNIRRELGAPEGYILHFATGDPRENTNLVLRAFQQARSRLPKGIKLVLAGGGAEAEALPEESIRLPFLTGERLITVFQGARLYVDPSLYEGFGFQILEAMACGIPTIATQCASVPEILGQAGFLVDPKDEDTFTERIIQVLTNENLWNRMRHKGLERAKQFRWEKAARETLFAYQEVLNEH